MTRFNLRQLKKWGEEIESVAQEVVDDLRRNIQAELTALEPEIEALKAKAGKAEADAKELIEGGSSNGTLCSDLEVSCDASRLLLRRMLGGTAQPLG